MATSKSIIGDKARKKLFEGVQEVYDFVSSTLGPRGRNIAITKAYRTQVLHDGVKIAREINPKDKFNNAGAEIIKQAAQRQVTMVGDGTTITVVLAHAIIKEALKLIDSGVNPMGLRSAIERGRDLLVEEIKKLSTPVITKNHKVQVATVSSQDKEMGQMIGETFHKIGTKGVLIAEDSGGAETELEHEDGMQVDSGYKIEHLITDPQKMTARVEKARVLVTDYGLNDALEIEGLMRNVLEENKERNFVVFASEIEGTALATFIQNKMQGRMNILAVKAPNYMSTNILQDIAVMTGANFVSKEAQMSLRELTINDLGYASSITSNRTSTLIVGGGGHPQEIEKRIESIKQQIEEDSTEFTKEKYQERLAKLSGGVYVLQVGGATEVERGEKIERAFDSILATRAAIDEGIIPGGETVYLKALNVLKPKGENEEYAFRILKNALKKPFTKLVENAGLDAGEYLAKLEDKEFGWGVNVETGTIENLKESGVIDPTLVAIEAVKNATSVAIALITSEGVIAEQEEPINAQK